MKVSLWLSSEYWSRYEEFKETIWSLGNSHWKGLERKISRAHTGKGLVPIPTNQRQKHHLGDYSKMEKN